MFIALFIVMHQALALPVINLNVNPEFKINDTVILKYTINSDIEEQINYIADVVCPNAPHPQLELKTTILQPNKPLIENFTYLTVDDGIEPQVCKATVTIPEPYSIIESKPIKIITNPSFEFELKHCKDASCQFTTEIFELNKDIYFDYSSNIKDILTETNLIFPDKTTKQITLPSSIIASQVGTYTLDVTASKDGYKTIHKTEQFGVIEKETPIKSASLCNGNGICDNNENSQNCPQDCPIIARQILSSEIKSSKDNQNTFYYTFYIAIAIIFIILLINIFRLKERNKF